MKTQCKNCEYFKMQSNPQTKELAKVCYALPPNILAVATQQGIAMVQNRPQVSDDDFCSLFHAGVEVSLIN